MGNLVVYFSKNENILKIVSRYKEMYQATSYEIETVNQISFFDKLSSRYFKSNINIKRCNINLASYQNIILVIPLWFNEIPLPVERFLEQQTGKIKKVYYVLYNNNKDDKPKEFDKMDKILNLRRENSYFVSILKNDVQVRVYQ